MEARYQHARERGEEAPFRAAIDGRHRASPDNLLRAAWHHRLAQSQSGSRELSVPWGRVVPPAPLNGLLFWWRTGVERYPAEAAVDAGRPPGPYGRDLRAIAAGGVAGG